MPAGDSSQGSAGRGTELRLGRLYWLVAGRCASSSQVFSISFWRVDPGFSKHVFHAFLFKYFLITPSALAGPCTPVCLTVRHVLYCLKRPSHSSVDEWPFRYSASLSAFGQA